MLIGLDFDNTIACYDQAIKIMADRLFELPAEVPRTKIGLRNYLRNSGQEHAWTIFQGELYGPGMEYAEPFEKSIVSMQKLIDLGHELVIVSHRSRKPYAGKDYDLHTAARNWVANHLQANGLFGNKGDESKVHFLENREDKVSMISDLECDIFVDDLPEVLEALDFLPASCAILFNPGDQSRTPNTNGSQNAITSWDQLPLLLPTLKRNGIQ